ncbi:MAG: hypothetical protein RIQ56_194 [Candidatus Parcubacteria bacterium]|jgi:uncharacterized protein YcbX
MTVAVSSLHIYPVKSCKGISLTEGAVGVGGFQHDREWVIVEEDGYFITQRQFPKMALIVPEVRQGALALSAPGVSELLAPIIEEGKQMKVTVWESVNDAVDQGEAAAEWLSAFIGKKVRLARMAPGFQRKLKEKYQITGNESVGFADSMPFLALSEESLSDLNVRLKSPVEMNRFRPNIVLSGGSAFQEDSWKRIKIGEVTLRFAKQCSRCEITTVDQEKGEMGEEPLETLGTYRSKPKGIMFGADYIPENLGTIHVGDPVHVLE